MTAYERLIEALEAHGSRVEGNGRQRKAQCPAPDHADSDPSLSVTAASDRVLVNCQAGCPTDIVLAAIGWSAADLFDEPRERHSRPSVTAEYRYTDEAGRLLFVKERRFPKDFRIRRPDGNGGWIPNLGDTPRVLYRLPEVTRAVREHRMVWLVEGEKDADRLAALGECATTNYDGAARDGQRAKWRDEYSNVLAGADVTIIADRDDAGLAHARAAAASLDGKAASVRIAQSATAREHDDVSDHLDAGHSLGELVEPAMSEWIAPDEASVSPNGQAPARAGDDDLAALAEIAANFTPVDWQAAWDARPDDVQWLIEPIIEAGQSVALYATPGTGKSLIALECAAALATGRPVLGNPARDPVTVVYVDVENRQHSLVERLQAFNYKPADLGRLVMYSFPSLAVLDSLLGGQQILALAVTRGAAIVIIDTTSRVIAGGENDADTWLAFYRHTVVPLRARGIAMLRLDHPGKDVSRGARGSSAKKGDVDAEWLLTRITDTTFALDRQKERDNHGDAALALCRCDEPLRHEVTAGSGDRVGEIAADLDRLGVPPDAGRVIAGKALKAAGIKARNADIAAAVKQRKERSPDLEMQAALPGMQSDPQSAGTGGDRSAPSGPATDDPHPPHIGGDRGSPPNPEAGQ